MLTLLYAPMGRFCDFRLLHISGINNPVAEFELRLQFFSGNFA